MIKFHIGASRGKSVVFPVSKCIIKNLISKSKWLEAIIKHDLFGDTICLPETCPRNFELLLKLLHTEDFGSLIDQEVMDLLHLSNMWLFKDLEDQCSEWLRKSAALNCMDWNDLYNDISILDLNNNLNEDAFYFLKWNLTQILNEESYMNWNDYTWLKVLCCDNLGVPEIMLYHALERWIYENDPTRNTIDRLLSQIRFPLMGSEDFENIVVSSGLLQTIKIHKMREYYRDSTTCTGLEFDVTPRTFNLGTNDGVQF